MTLKTSSLGNHMVSICKCYCWDRETFVSFDVSFVQMPIVLFHPQHTLFEDWNVSFMFFFLEVKKPWDYVTFFGFFLPGWRWCQKTSDNNRQQQQWPKPPCKLHLCQSTSEVSFGFPWKSHIRNARRWLVDNRGPLKGLTPRIYEIRV